MADVTFIGIDAGATQTRLRAEARGESLELQSSGVNLRRASIESCAKTLERAIGDALQKLPSPRVHIVAGIAGGYDPRLTERLAGVLEAYLEERATDCRLLLQGDVELAHSGGFENGVGITAIAGTGSVVYGRNAAGSSRLVGGWGYLLGDEGSGTAIGVDALREVCVAIDNDQSDALRDVVGVEFGLYDRNAILEFAYGDGSAVQRLAPVVLRLAEQSEAAAVKIVRDQTSLLAAQIRTAERILQTGTSWIAASGGLMQNVFYLKTLSAAVNKVLPGLSVRYPERDAVTEALRQARLLRIQ